MNRNNKMEMVKTLFVIVAFSLFSAMNTFAQKANKVKESQVNKSTVQLSGEWVLKEMEDIELSHTFQKVIPTINIDAEKMMLSGQNSCNSFSAPIEIKGNKILYKKDFQQTLKACEGDGEQQFMDALKTVKVYLISEDGNQLDFVTQEKGIMKFKRIVQKNK